MAGSCLRHPGAIFRKDPEIPVCSLLRQPLHLEFLIDGNRSSGSGLGDLHRTRCVTLDRLRNTSQQEPFKRGTRMRADNDQVRRTGSGAVDNDDFRVVVPYRAAFRLPTFGPQACDRLLDRALYPTDQRARSLLRRGSMGRPNGAENFKGRLLRPGARRLPAMHLDLPVRCRLPAESS